MDIGDTNASISDTNGELLFYTNGIYVSNANNEVMENGDTINNFGITSTYSDGGLTTTQGVMVLPFPGKENLYYLFHEPIDYDENGIGFHQPYFLYSTVDMELNNNLGSVIQKDLIIIQDTLSSGKITACKHGNGRDWWIVVPKYDGGYSHIVYKMLLTPEGVTNVVKQDIGPGTSYNEPSVGNAVFSPNGSMYIKQDLRFEPWNAINIYNFNRCTGNFEHTEYIELQDTSFIYGGAAVSPSSKFLFTSTNNRVFQFDLTAPDIEATKTKVAEFDGYVAFWFPSYFGTPQLGPNGKIYIASAVGDTVMHVINTPNQPGMGSHLAQHSINLPNLNDKSIPNFPNYRLGPLDGSPCDTLGLDNHPLAGFTPLRRRTRCHFLRQLLLPPRGMGVGIRRCQRKHRTKPYPCL